MILVPWGAEDDVNLYIEWFIRISRKHAKMLNQVKEYWDHSSWTTALAMRGQTIGMNMTFKQATNDILNDLSALNNIFIAVPSPPPPATGTRTKVPAASDGSQQEETWTKTLYKKKGGGNSKDGKGKGKGKDGRGRGIGRGGGGRGRGGNGHVKKDDWSWKKSAS
ncbi:unnamed protein product [Polarella glacialis]|uniref:Uncharacterized protein n=1 Tax=Polarella glacialis TaxID=89957 RepID=A0A813F1Y8_POLGL|nr:unnamed protein product [Polarella glacialis]